jgi:hypothetical protein
MDLEGDNPVPEPTAAEPLAAQNIHVTPANVVALAAMFRACADNLEPEVAHIKDDLYLDEPWLLDPVSKWARDWFNGYFVYCMNSFASVTHAEYRQHLTMRDALVATAEQYGLIEELIAAGFTVGPSR